VRATLSMRALSPCGTTRCSKPFLSACCAAGKAKKVALTACMRKLLTILACHGETSDPLAITGGVYRLKMSNGPLTIKTVAPAPASLRLPAAAERQR